jgi:hypothetical protein
MRAAILSRRCCGDARVCALLRKLCEQGHPIGHTVVRHSRGLGIARSRRRRPAARRRASPRKPQQLPHRRKPVHLPCHGNLNQNRRPRLSRCPCASAGFFTPQYLPWMTQKRPLVRFGLFPHSPHPEVRKTNPRLLSRPSPAKSDNGRRPPA